MPTLRRLPWTETDARTRLRGALLQGHLRLEYQPVVRTQGGAVAGVEALVRWDDPKFGTVMPLQFIPLAERGDLITLLGEWVVQKASAQAVGWFRRLGARAFVSVNVSPRQLLTTAFSDRLQRILEETGLPARQLVVEVTETLAIDQRKETIRELETIRSLGVRVAADDVGEGYMSLRTVSQLPIDVIKIPRQVMVPTSPLARRGFLESLVRYAEGVGVTTIAEGVETEEQFLRACDAGCDAVQGRYVSWPLPPEGAEEFLATGWAPPAARDGTD